MNKRNEEGLVWRVKTKGKDTIKRWLTQMILFPLNLAGLDDQQTPDGHQGHRRKQFSQYSHFSSSRSFRFEAMKTRTSASTHAHGNVKSAKETFAFAGLIFPPFVFLSIPLPLKTPVKHHPLLVDSSAVEVRTIHWTICTGKKRKEDNIYFIFSTVERI